MKKFISIILTVALVLAFSMPVLASGDLTKVVSSAKTKITGIISTIGTVIAIAMLMYIGIKYMLASAGEKANLKTALVPYLVGAVLLGAAATLAPLITGFGEDL